MCPGRRDSALDAGARRLAAAAHAGLRTFRFGGEAQVMENPGASEEIVNVVA